jgi:hypothetical protein
MMMMMTMMMMMKKKKNHFREKLDFLFLDEVLGRE